jgi:translation initiation factor IF-3
MNNNNNSYRPPMNRPPMKSGTRKEGSFAPKRDAKKDGFKMNFEINAAQVRVIDDEGGMLGVMTPKEAVAMAQARGLDLIEVAPNATPPTCKIMDYGKYKYEQKKKAQVSKKNQVTIDIKEIQLRPRTEDHDLETKLRHAKRFLEDGDKVKFNLRYKGREMVHQELGKALMDKVVEQLKGIGILETAPKMEGKQFFCLIQPDPAHLKEVQKKKKQAAAQAASATKKDEKES